MEENTALVDTYLKLKKRWWRLLWWTLGAVFLGTRLHDLALLLGPVFGIVVIVYLFLCYASQVELMHDMAGRVDLPRVSNQERGFWYTLMLLGLLALAPGMIIEVGLFLLYARRFISHTNTVRLETTAQA